MHCVKEHRLPADLGCPIRAQGSAIARNARRLKWQTPLEVSSVRFKSITFGIGKYDSMRTFSENRQSQENPVTISCDVTV